MSSTKYTLRDMARYFLPPDEELSHTYGIFDQTYWLTLGSCTAPTKDSSLIANSGKRMRFEMTGRYVYKGSIAPVLYFQLGTYKSKAITLNTDGQPYTFSLVCDVPASASISEKQGVFKADNVRDGSISLTSLTLSAYELVNSSEQSLDTVSDCMTVIANWIRKQN
ncbi:hypothetical protein [Limosilactobacillus oris]|uniref:hypothetical protein n=1 Tax=Limosilactobacillus oris TaxID=1632 RepID=UPI0024B33755|nr:hypothetical protein [Limosilactobacillus oris]WHO84878.1 hypothetical protein QLX69_05770 [Limosilactobacillus oris]